MEEELSFNIIGNKGAISLKNWSEIWTSNKDSKLEKIDIEGDHLVSLLDNIFRAIDEEDSIIIDFKEGYKTHRVIE